MEIVFWGTRGAISAPKSDQMAFGTHTTCIEIKHDADSLIFDAGFGIGRYSDALPRKIGTYHLFFTHFHWDHVQGIGYFIPIFLPQTHLHLYSPWTEERLKRQLNYYFDYSFGPFPSIESLSSQIHYHSIENLTLVNGFEICYFPNRHEGSCYGYSIARNGEKIAVLTDHEAEESTSYRLWGTDYDLVIHDGQYTDEEYARSHRGDGHSSMTRAIENARNMGAQSIILTHHAPLRSDAELFDLERALQQSYPTLTIIIAREQMKYSIA